MVYRIDMFEERCLVQLLRVGTYTEVGHAYRGVARFSRKVEFISTGEWFYPKDLYMICLLIICISFMKACLSCHIAWKVVIAWHDIIGILISVHGTRMSP